jgi:hypothetical protein
MIGRVGSPDWWGEAPEIVFRSAKILSLNCQWTLLGPYACRAAVRRLVTARHAIKPNNPIPPSVIRSFAKVFKSFGSLAPPITDHQSLFTSHFSRLTFHHAAVSLPSKKRTRQRSPTRFRPLRKSRQKPLHPVDRDRLEPLRPRYFEPARN